MILWLPLICSISLALLVVYSLFDNMMIRRRQEVYEYHKKISAKVIVASFSDAFQDRSSKWRTDKFREIVSNYDRMIYSFWRPIDSFYPDQRFSDPKYTEDPSVNDIL